jgi:hypothetical protein
MEERERERGIAWKWNEKRKIGLQTNTKKFQTKKRRKKTKRKIDKVKETETIGKKERNT